MTKMFPSLTMCAQLCILHKGSSAPRHGIQHTEYMIEPC